MARGRFVGLFHRGIAQQATGTGTAMVGELGGPWCKKTPLTERLTFT